MKKLYFALCLIFVWCTTAFAYDILYVVGDACSSGWDPNAALAMTKESADSYTWSGPLKKNSGKQERSDKVLSGGADKIITELSNEELMNLIRLEM